MEQGLESLAQHFVAGIDHHKRLRVGLADDHRPARSGRPGRSAVWYQVRRRPMARGIRKTAMMIELSARTTQTSHPAP